MSGEGLIDLVCSICNEGIKLSEVGSLDNLWQHRCYKNIQTDMFDLALNRANKLEPMAKNPFKCYFCEEIIQETHDYWEHFCFKNDYSSSEFNLVLTEDFLLMPEAIVNSISDSIDLSKEAGVLSEIINSPVKKKTKSKCTEDPKEKGNLNRTSKETLEKENVDNSKINKSKKGKHLVYSKKNPDLLTDEVTEELIEFVKDRPCLWDLRLPYGQRSTLHKSKAWDNICNVQFEGKYDLDEVKKRWKDVRDSYSRKKAVTNKYIPSGSGRLETQDSSDDENSSNNAGEKCKFVQQLSFLDDGSKANTPSVSSHSKGTPNTPTPTAKEDESKSPASNKFTPAKKSKNKVDELLIDFMTSNNKDNDDIDSFTHYLGTCLREIESNKKRKQLQRRIMNDVHQALEEQEDSGAE